MKVVKMKIVHRKKEDRAEAIADDLMKKYNGNQQEDEDGEQDYSELLLRSIENTNRNKQYWKTIDQENGDY